MSETIYVYEFQCTQHETTRDLNEAQVQARTGSKVWQVKLDEEKEITDTLQEL